MLEITIAICLATCLNFTETHTSHIHFGNVCVCCPGRLVVLYPGRLQWGIAAYHCTRTSPNTTEGKERVNVSNVSNVKLNQSKKTNKPTKQTGK